MAPSWLVPHRHGSRSSHHSTQQHKDAGQSDKTKVHSNTTQAQQATPAAAKTPDQTRTSPSSASAPSSSTAKPSSPLRPSSSSSSSNSSSSPSTPRPSQPPQPPQPPPTQQQQQQQTLPLPPPPPPSVSQPPTSSIPASSSSSSSTSSSSLSPATTFSSSSSSSTDQLSSSAFQSRSPLTPATDPTPGTSCPSHSGVLAAPATPATPATPTQSSSAKSKVVETQAQPQQVQPSSTLTNTVAAPAPTLRPPASVRFDLDPGGDQDREEETAQTLQPPQPLTPVATTPPKLQIKRRSAPLHQVPFPSVKSPTAATHPSSAASSSHRSQRSRPSSPTFNSDQAAGGSDQPGTFSPSSSSIQARARLSSILHPAGGSGNNTGDSRRRSSRDSRAGRGGGAALEVPTSANAGGTTPRQQAHHAKAASMSMSMSTTTTTTTTTTAGSSSRRAAGPLPGTVGGQRASADTRRSLQSSSPRPSPNGRANGNTAAAAAAAASPSRPTSRERERAAARQAERDNWEKTRGAGSSVLTLVDLSEGAKKRDWAAEDVLPALEDVEGKKYEPVEVPSADVLLSRGITDYTILPKVLGRGKFSTVFMASKNGELSAVKHTALFPHHHLISTRLLREPTLLAELPPHPNLVEVKETIRTPGHFYLVEEYLGGYVTLEALLGKLGVQRASSSGDGAPTLCLPLHVADVVLSQLLSAVRAIHYPLQICHRDIKPENILVHEETLQLKLLDFGLATHYSKSEPKLTTCCGSPAFHCPEIVKALASTPGSVSYWGPEVDAWTCGVTMLRVLTGVRYPLGSSHSSLRSMAIRAQRAVTLIPLRDAEDNSDESLGRSMRDKVAKLLDMDSVKRMRYFEEMAVERDGIAEPQRGAKNFKSTTFVPTEPSHKMDLPLLSARSTERISMSSIGGASSSAGGYPFPFSASSAASTPMTSRRGTPANSRPPSPGGRGNSSSTDRGAQRSVDRSERGDRSGDAQLSAAAASALATRIILMNPSMQPAQRVLSYIKYCLRCAGILYHCWPDARSGTAAASSSTTAAMAEAWSAGISESLPNSLGGNGAALGGAEGNGNGATGTWSPTTPLFPPSGSGGERSDGWAHVQVFQCVIEWREPDPASGASDDGAAGGVPGLGLVQSIMAAFGRRPAPGKRSNSQPSLSPARSAGTAAAAGTATATPTARDKDGGNAGPTKYLTFYMVARFPRMTHTRSYSRPGFSRQGTWVGTAAGRGSRASSAAVPPVAGTVPGAVIPEEGKKDVPSGMVGAAPLTHTQSLVEPTAASAANKPAKVAEDKSGAATPTKRNSAGGASTAGSGSVNGSAPPSPHAPHVLAIETHPDVLRTLGVAPAPHRSNTPSRTRKGSRPHRPSRNKVFIEVCDERAVEAVRSALAVGGVVDSSDAEEQAHAAMHYYHHRSKGASLGGVAANCDSSPLPEGSEPATPTYGDQHPRKHKSRSRNGRSQSYAGTPRGGRSSGPAGATSMQTVLNSDALEQEGDTRSDKSSPAGSRTRGGRSAGPGPDSVACRGSGSKPARAASATGAGTSSHEHSPAPSAGAGGPACAGIGAASRHAAMSPAPSPFPVMVDEQERRGRNMTRAVHVAAAAHSHSQSHSGSGSGSGSGSSTPSSGSTPAPAAVPPLSSSSSAKRAPSKLSSVPVTEESPASADNLAQLVEDLQSTLVSLCGASARVAGAKDTAPSTAAAVDASLTHSIDVVGCRQQARGLLQSIQRRLRASCDGDDDDDALQTLIFPLLSALSPALGLQASEAAGLPEVGDHVERISTLRGLARCSMLTIAKTCSPREVVMGVQERLEVLLRDEATPVPDESDESSDEGSGSGPQHATAPSSSPTEWLAALELAALLDVLAEVIPRLRTKKPAGFIRPLSALIQRAAARFLAAVPVCASASALVSSPQPAVQSPTAPTPAPVPMTTRTEAALEVARALCDFTRVGTRWAGEVKAEADAEAVALAPLFLGTFAALSPSLPLPSQQAHAGLAETHFLAKNPRYRLGPSAPASSPVSAKANASAGIWESLQSASCGAGGCLGPDSGLEALLAYCGSAPATATARTDSLAVQLEAFLLYVKLAFREGESKKDSKPPKSASLPSLRATLPILMACLGSGSGSRISTEQQQAAEPRDTSEDMSDCALLWIMWCLEGSCSSAAAASDDDDLTLTLVQLLSTHAALSPLPAHRHVAWRVLSDVVLRLREKALVVDVLRDLIAESPFPQLRCASVGLLREWFVRGGASSSGKAEAELEQKMLNSTRGVLFSLPAARPLPLPRAGASEADARTYLEEHTPWLTECCNILYVLLARAAPPAALDLGLAAVERDFLAPLRELLSAWETREEKENEEKGRRELQSRLSILRVSVARCDEAVRTRR